MPADDAVTAEAPLILRFEPQTVDHLGARMYSHLPNALAELVANAYDADAHNVRIEIGPDPSIKVTDDGHGMSRTDVADKYLHIGRNRRDEEGRDRTESGERRVSGKKGLGKLALFGIGKDITLTTTRRGSADATSVHLSYDDLMKTHGEYRPESTTATSPAPDHGTAVTLRNLKRRTPIKCDELARSLARLFEYIDKDFSVTVIDRTGQEHPVTADLRLEAVTTEFTWDFPESFNPDDTYLADHRISGRIISAEKPLKGDSRGITLYVNGRMANEPEFFGGSESSFAFSYLTGYLNVDFLDSLPEDVIATDRRAIVWDNDEMQSLRTALSSLLQRIGQERRERRSVKRKKERETRTGINTDQWVGSLRSDKVRNSLERLISSISSDDLNITGQQESILLEEVHRLVPEYAELFWRHLEEGLRETVRPYYERADYFTAVTEGIKRYIKICSEKTGIPHAKSFDVVSRAFGKNGKLAVFAKYASTGNFTDMTAGDIEAGQQQLSQGIVTSFRNTISHEEIAALQMTGALTYEDCLDALSILSYLMRRLDGAETRE